MREKVRRSPEGVIIAPELHDGELTGIVLSSHGERSDLLLYATSCEGPRFKIEIPNIVRLRVDNFLEGNIIFELELFEGMQISTKDLQDVYLSDDYSDVWLGEGGRAAHCLLKVSTSYGCEGRALFEAPASAVYFELEK